MIRPMSKENIEYFWHFNNEQKEVMLTKFVVELPTLRAKIGVSQEDIANTIGVSRQTYGAYERGGCPMPWSIYLALLFYFDYIPCTHRLIRVLKLFPTEFDECWLAAKVLECEEGE